MGASTLLLAGDIGGTKTILQLVAVMGDGSAVSDALTVRYEKEYPSGDFPDLVPMVTQFFQEAIAANQLDEAEKPVRACFGIAGPVVDNGSKLTNLGWTLTGDRLGSALGIGTVTLINDFVAVGYGVLGLDGDQLHVLQAGDRDPDAPIAVIGAGTGLGQGFLVKAGDRHRVFSSEGGHVDFAPRSELEWELADYLCDRLGLSRVSVERVVSGQGIVGIYQFLRDIEFAPESATVGDAIRQWERSGRSESGIDPSAVIAGAANQNSDALCEATMKLFISAYGAEAGNLALKLLPRGGLYLAGGIAAKNLPLMTDGTFMDALKNKGRVSPLLDQVPMAIVLEPRVGLLGAAICAAQG